MFTDDDAARLDAIIQAALPHLELLLTQHQQASSLVRLNHELQNPLLGINGAVDAFKTRLKARGIINIKDTFGADYIADILSYTALMSRLVLNSRLFGDTFERLRPEFARCDLAVSVVEPVTKQLSPLLKRYNLPDNRIRVAQFKEVIPWLYVDKLMMQQVFFNLITNAIKYRDRPENFRVDIRADVKRDADGIAEWFIVDIEDWGIGLDTEDDPNASESLFMPGVRGVSASKRKDPSGTGIGLTVVREIVELHGGNVRFVPNRGLPESLPPDRSEHLRHSARPYLFRNPTRIRLQLPGYLRHGKPKLA